MLRLNLALLIAIIPLQNANPITYSSDDGYNNCNFYTNGEKKFLEHYLNDDMSLIIDVGANVGEWSLIVSSIAPKAFIYAFEPHPKIFQILEKKTEDKNIVCLPYALSNSKRKVRFCVWGDESDLEKSGLNGIYYRPILKKLLNASCKEIWVSTTTLDDFCQKEGVLHINLLKIDTEGSEVDILKGSKALLQSGAINCIQFEYGGCYLDSKTTLKSIYENLTCYGYEIFRILPTKLKRIYEWDDSLENYQYSNYIALKKELDFLIQRCPYVFPTAKPNDIP